MRLQVDLFCKVRWREPEDAPCEQDVVLRVWGLDDAVIFRNHLDAEHLYEPLILDGRRVMLRYHFDLANEGQTGPRYHVQAGGNSLDNEYCWLHEAISVPRLLHPPVDLVLACELVAANFFGDHASRLLDDAQWVGVMRQSQEHLLMPYFSQCSNALAHGDSVLRHLWNT
jgi:hypothetical protein